MIYPIIRSLSLLYPLTQPKHFISTRRSNALLAKSMYLSLLELYYS